MQGAETMKAKTNLITGIVCYVVSAILIIYYLILEFSILSVTSPIDRIKIILVIIVLMYFGSLFLRKEKESLQKLSSINMWIWFLLYITMLLNLTLFDKYFGRGVTLNIKDPNQIKDYLAFNFNIIPFATISNYILALKNNNLSDLNFIYNIFGNILAFMPLAFFIPRLFKKINKWYKFFLITSLIIITIEFFQMLTMSGSFDIDDYILNIFGSMIAYLILNNKKLKVYIDKFIYLKY